MEQAHAVVFKGKAPSSMMCYVPLDTALEAFDLAAAEYNETTNTIDQLISVKVQMEQVIMSLSPIEQIILTLHVEQNMNLREIAEKSNYSYIHVRRTAIQLRNKTATDLTAWWCKMIQTNVVKC